MNPRFSPVDGLDSKSESDEWTGMMVVKSKDASKLWHVIYVARAPQQRSWVQLLERMDNKPIHKNTNNGDDNDDDVDLGAEDGGIPDYIGEEADYDL